MSVYVASRDRVTCVIVLLPLRIMLLFSELETLSLAVKYSVVVTYTAFFWDVCVSRI